MTEEQLKGMACYEMYPEIQYVKKNATNSTGRRAIRFYDLDGNLIEVGESM